MATLMNGTEPDTKAQALSNELHEGTGTVTYLADRLRDIATALHMLGIPVGDELLEMSAELKVAARRSSAAFNGYLCAQLNGTLYNPPDLSAERQALGLK